MFICITQLADTFLSQGICDYIKKQGAPGVFREHIIGEVGCLARIKSHQAS